MIINFIGNFHAGPGGEAADQTHLARELESLGHIVRRVPQDIWKAYCDGENNPDWQDKLPVKADISIITKWHHFNDKRYIEVLHQEFMTPVFYWVWDWMDKEEWHITMAKAADLYLSGELGSAHYYKEQGIKFYYLQFDSCDGQYPPMGATAKDFDVVFLGSCTNQNGRLDILKEINKKVKIQVFGWDYEEWRKQGFQAAPPAYGLEFNRIIAQSKIVLGTSANVDCFGYWSNRVGKVLHAGGFLLQWYTPGMENLLADCCDYFSSADEAVEKIKFYLANPDKREEVIERNILLNKDRWTSAYKVRQLTVLMERYLKTKGEGWILP